MAYSVEEARAQAETTYRKAMARLDGIAEVAREAEIVLAEWRAGRPDRDGCVWVSEGSVMLYLGLAADEIFASAEEAFCRAQDALKGALLTGWVGEWGPVKDESQAHQAERGAMLTAAAAGKHWYDDGALVSLSIYAPIRSDSVCRVEQIGEREVTYSEQHKRRVPVFRAVCPGDAVEVAA